ncbi:putative polygalacturonase [Glycine soja]
MNAPSTRRRLERRSALATRWRHAPLCASRGVLNGDLSPHKPQDAVSRYRYHYHGHSGFVKLAFDCTIAILWKRKGTACRKVYEFYPWRWSLGCGENGTIDGQGDEWWNKWKQRTLQFTRPNLVEFVNSRDIIISNIIFKSSPFRNIHPYSNVVVRYVTILAPRDSPNTDGIDPHSSSNVCIEDSYISTGDDLVAEKSGWDEYGIVYGRPSSDITIRRVTGSSPFAGIAIGSETSGGVENVLSEHINLYNMGIGIHIKTNTGRAGYIKNITMSHVYMEEARKGIRISGDVGDHPDDKYDPNALPLVKGVTIKNVWGVKVLQAGLIQGLSS